MSNISRSNRQSSLDEGGLCSKSDQARMFHSSRMPFYHFRFTSKGMLDAKYLNPLQPPKLEHQNGDLYYAFS